MPSGSPGGRRGVLQGGQTIILKGAEVSRREMHSPSFRVVELSLGEKEEGLGKKEEKKKKKV